MFEWLKDYKKLEEEIAYLEYNLEKSKAELKRWTSGNLQNVRLTAESEGAKVEDRIEAIEFELAHKMNEEYDLKLLMNKFAGLDHQILKMKYVDGMTLELIAFELHYSTGYIRRKHAEIRKIVKFLDGF
ncbi:HTH transcription regulator [Bacillus cereus Rock3-28]|nr:HTH transcription regulator [Bacillus cereus Rock3-28]